MVNGVEPLRERYQREPGLRERKKLAAMRHIQDTAVRLFVEHGFAAVTIERVAAEAEVSPSSVYRYFGTKEHLILYDETDPVGLRRFDELLAEHEPVDALRRFLREIESYVPDDTGQLRSRLHFMLTEPSVRRVLGEEIDQVEAVLREMIAARTGLEAHSMRVRVFVTAMVRGIIAAVEYWHDTGAREPLGEVIDEAVTMLTEGLSFPSVAG
ncbi:hypothetical protein BJF85_07550 [Saccharomonospora sp. CUA-673]|uniref:TetR/AcrR family transcriptional regulator n=1 Tax=Saccharomonospora sp. CUA-673 TaxID=1904969 RepID=UPI000961BF2E|nr:TetR family transcriptional regulator [Saccharomonospora sp. CUA-673]OLT39061.1 hypothetical protein BJF85_07550 [Saccharomonospora sp. CUA-673]